MSDKIEDVVDRTIEHTLTIVAITPEIWPVARIGVQKIYDDLAADASDHPALKRLSAFIADAGRARGSR